MRIRGAIFDVDGTLLDSMFIWDTIGETYLRSIGYEPREKLNEVFKNMSLFQAARYYRTEYGVTLSIDEIMNGVNAMLERYYRFEVSLKPGVAELLAQLQASGVKLCIATATDRYLVEAGFPVAAVYDSHEKAQDQIRMLADVYLEELTQLDKIRKYLPA
ncbi:HAD hydrolase-like protein [Oscillospiraceae bacterium 50-16]